MQDQERMPIVSALEKYRQNRIVSFDVPGHKQGRGNPKLNEFFGEKMMSIDVNSMKSLDNLCHPTSVIKEAEDLAAQAFGANHAFLMVNGTSSSVATMIMATCKSGDKLIMPRNVHRSAINTLVVAGIIPVYVNPGIHQKLGISLGMAIKDIKDAIKNHPKAKAILVNNPTYYGICSNLKEIVRLAHAANMKVLVDEAHGTHFYFGEDLPINGMKAGADMAAVSTHKTGGSLTQSSFLLTSKAVNEDYVRQIINLTQTTSGSYILMASLDIARSFLALHGKETYQKVIDFASYARNEINKLGDYNAFGRELVDGDQIYDYDITKLSIHTRDIGLAGKEVYDILRDEYDIQIELGDIGNILAIISVGDRSLEIERLIGALSEIKRRYLKDKQGMLTNEYIQPIIVLSPKEAFYAKKTKLSLKDSLGRISGEFVMAYPPGIPILAPGEEITKAVLEYIDFAKDKGCLLTGCEDLAVEVLNVVED